MKRIPCIALIAVSAATLGLLHPARAALPSLTVQVPTTTAIDAAQAAASNAIHAATIAWLTNQMLQAAPAPTPVVIQGVSTNGQSSVRIVLPNQASAVALARDATTPAMLMSQQMGSLGPCVRPGSGLIGWWQAEYDADDSAGTNHAQLANGAYFDSGMVGQAFWLDGASQSIQVPYASNLISASFTFEMWVYPSAPIGWQAFVFGQGYGRQLVVQAGETGLWVALYVTDLYGNFTGLGSSTEIPIEAWTHLAGTFDGTYLKLYINGALDAQGEPGLAAIGDSTCPLSIGGANNSCGYYGQYFPGLIDEVSLYDRALFAGEIDAIYLAGAAGKCKSPPACVLCPDSGVSWWAAEGDASDAFRTNAGTLQNSPGFDAGLVGQAFSFDGVSQAVTVPYAASLTNSAFSVEAWVNPAGQVDEGLIFGQNYGRRLVVRAGNRGLGVALVVSTNRLSSFEVESSAEIPLGEWTHLAGTWDPGSPFLSLYINGALDQQATLDVVPWDSGCAFHIGGVYEPSGDCATVDYFFDGLIDEVTLYNTALAPEEVLAIYNASAAGKCNTPGAWLEQYFGANYRTDPNAALNADPDADGLTNLQEYLQGRNPIVAGTVSDTSGLINLQVYTVFK